MSVILIAEGKLRPRDVKGMELLNRSGDVEQRTAEALGAQHHCWD